VGSLAGRADLPIQAGQEDRRAQCPPPAGDERKSRYGQLRKARLLAGPCDWGDQSRVPTGTESCPVACGTAGVGAGRTK
jgi:hypothetical protein